jgi:ABC-type lipoprotein release transport system permease subunit
MDRRTLARRGFRYYARTNAAVIAGVAIAVAVLTGALITGDSVRVSLRELALSRLGKTAQVLASAQFFREELAAETGSTPLIALEGVVSKQEDNQRAGGVQVYGVDDRFWRFHGVPEHDDFLISPGLAAELSAKVDDSLLLRIEKPSAIPRESLHGRKEDTGKTIRFKVGSILPRAEMGEFSLKPGQGALKAVFIGLKRLQKDLEQAGRVNTLLFGEGVKADLAKMQLRDLGVKLIELPDNRVSVETESAVLSDGLESAAVATAGAQNERYYTYLVNSMRAGTREVPYSLVTAASSKGVAAGEIALNDWAARDLGVKPGDAITLDYYLWDPSGSLLTRSAKFTLVHVDPTKDDRTLAPEYPGITQSSTLADWDPPFPMDLKKVRPIDEEYWKLYRTTPKGFINIEDGRKLWGSRFGHVTSVRAVKTPDFAARLRAALRPEAMGVALVDVRASALGASKGSTDFGEYFLYFSFFLMVSALLLTVVFFQLNIDQRLREAGLLRAIGFTEKDLQGHFLREGMPLAGFGTLAGLALGIAYSAFILYGLRTWWRGAVGTSELSLHVTPLALQAGLMGGLAAAFLTILLSARALRKSTPRDLLSGSRGVAAIVKPSKKLTIAAALCFVFALLLSAAGAAKAMPAAGAFFGAGFLSLTGGILWIRNRLRAAGKPIVDLRSMGERNTSWKPNRSALCITLIASAVFLLISLESFRQADSDQGSGGFTMIAESQLPIVYDLNTQAGREALNIKSDQNKFYAFRLKPGDDASCLNLYEPRNPRVIGATAEFLNAKRFDGAPWGLLSEASADGAVPAIADLNSAMYVLHKQVGDLIDLPGGVKLRLVATIAGSVLQSELIVDEKNFIRLFPQEQGYRFFLIDGPTANGPALEDALSDFGFDASTTRERLAAFHQVENTYLSTFQALGALGLLLGVAGLAAVLMRNVYERRKELGLLRAVGFRGDQLAQMVMSENGHLLGTGVVLGLACAAIAIAPTVIDRGLRGLPVVRITILVALIAAAGFLSSIAAVRFVRKLPLLASLRSDS